MLQKKKKIDKKLDETEYRQKQQFLINSKKNKNNTSNKKYTYKKQATQKNNTNRETTQTKKTKQKQKKTKLQKNIHATDNKQKRNSTSLFVS